MLSRRQFLGVMLMTAAAGMARQAGPIKLPAPCRAAPAHCGHLLVE